MPISKASSNAVAPGAKGDLVVGTTTNDSGILGVGSNGETLVADSSTSTGLRWQGSMAAGKNAVINGGMDIWQRGTSFGGTTLGAYCADRWGYYRGGAVGGATWSRQTSGLTGFQYSLRAQRTAGDTSTQYVGTWQGVETINAIPYAGKTVTLSFWAKCGANFSPSSGLLSANLITGTGTDEAPYSFTGGITAISQGAALTTSWQRFSYTATLNSNTNEIAIQFLAYPTGTAGANDWYEITGVQVELGSVATSFQRAGGNIAGELAACQRYYQRVTGTSASQEYANGIAYSTTAATNFVFPHKVTMRVGPTAIDYSNIRLFDGVSTVNTTSIVLTYGGADISYLDATVASGLTQYRPYTLLGSSASTYLGFSAEL